MLKYWDTHQVHFFVSYVNYWIELNTLTCPILPHLHLCACSTDSAWNSCQRAHGYPPHPTHFRDDDDVTSRLLSLLFRFRLLRL